MGLMVIKNVVPVTLPRLKLFFSVTYGLSRGINKSKKKKMKHRTEKNIYLSSVHLFGIGQS